MIVLPVAFEVAHTSGLCAGAELTGREVRGGEAAMVWTGAVEWSPVIVVRVLYIPYIWYVLDHAISSSQLVWAFLFFTLALLHTSQGPAVTTHKRHGTAHTTVETVDQVRGGEGECAATTTTITITTTITTTKFRMRGPDRHGLPGNGVASTSPRGRRGVRIVCVACGVWRVSVWHLRVSSSSTRLDSTPPPRLISLTWMHRLIR